jgi:hypothetical protein
MRNRDCQSAVTLAGCTTKIAVMRARPIINLKTMVGLWIALVLVAAPAKPVDAAASGNRKTQMFRTEVKPRIDTVFGGPAQVRAAIDAFLQVQKEMDQTRGNFSMAVHETLSLLPQQRAGKKCPKGIAASYQRAHATGTEFLNLGARLRELNAEIARAYQLRETAGLTPDYRFKAKQAAEFYSELLRDYREMRTIFHDQLGTELRYAGCDTRELIRATVSAAATTVGPRPDPEDATDWSTLPEEPIEPKAPLTAKVDSGDASARAIWIEVDNVACSQPSRLSIDGISRGEIPPGEKSAVRTRTGSRTLCLLPRSDKRICGDPGTERKTYLYEGLRLSVHCGSK